ncbi:MAG: hypothetical protein IKB71_04285 [Lentisphaeria bacterium]|nr:hypothetical protein [Lentisphaeria bacterium]
MTAYFFGILAGIFAGFVGIGYRIGSKGKVFPIQTALLLDAIGIVLFSWLGKWQYDMPLGGWGAGIVSGLTQYAAIRLLRMALQKGPLSPAWCAVGLAFVPVLVYCWFFCGEKPTVCQIFSVIATVGAIVAASIGNGKAAGGGHKLESKEAGIFYGILLVVIMLFVGISSYFLNIAATLLDAFGNQIMAVTYLFMLLPTVLDLSLSKTWQINRYFWLGGIFTAVGGIGAFGIQLLIMNAPAVVVFALPGVTSLLFVSLTSVFVFREIRTYYWYATVILAVAAILLNR